MCPPPGSFSPGISCPSGRPIPLSRAKAHSTQSPKVASRPRQTRRKKGNEPQAKKKKKVYPAACCSSRQHGIPSLLKIKISQEPLRSFTQPFFCLRRTACQPNYFLSQIPFHKQQTKPCRLSGLDKLVPTSEPLSSKSSYPREKRSPRPFCASAKKDHPPTKLDSCIELSKLNA